jgi:hypothetical protein
VQRRLGSDPLPLEARLGGDANAALDVRAKLERPNGTVLLLECFLVREVLKGNRLAEESVTAVGGVLLRVSENAVSGRIRVQGRPPRLRLKLTQPNDFQSARVLAALADLKGSRSWELDLVQPDVSGSVDLGAELRALGEFQRQVRTLIDDVDNDYGHPDREDATHRLASRIYRLSGELEKAGLRQRYPASLLKTTTYVEFLRVNVFNMVRRNGILGFPPGAAPATPAGAPFSFDALRQEFADAEELAAREFVLWVLKDAALDGRKPAHDELLRKQADFPGVRELIGAPEGKVRTLAP